MTSSDDLKKLLLNMNIHNFDIIRKKDIPYTHSDNVIINLDDYHSGSHWVAMNRKKKMYFDSYGMHMPDEVPSNYKYKTKIIEGINGNECGQLCCLWLWYVNNKSEKEFYSLFKKLY